MKMKLMLLASMVAVLLSAAPMLAQEFYVIAGSGPPVGTKITSLPYTIKNQGFYYLTGNLSYSGTGNGITVASDNVTIDLMGFCLTGPGSSIVPARVGIYLFDGIIVHNNVTVRNGTLNNWTWGLSDFNTKSMYGINNNALDLRVQNCADGIQFVGSNSGSMVKGCTVTFFPSVGEAGIYVNGGLITGNTVTNFTHGIRGGGTISGNYVGNCSIDGIALPTNSSGSVIGNTVVTTAADQKGIRIDTANPCLVTQNTVIGPGDPLKSGAGTINVASTNAGF